MYSEITEITELSVTPAERELVRALLFAYQAPTDDEADQERAMVSVERVIARSFGIVALYSMPDEEIERRLDSGDLCVEQVYSWLQLNKLISSVLNETGHEIMQVALTAHQKRAGDQSAEIIQFPSPASMH
jgi:hypothetical protein